MRLAQLTKSGDGSVSDVELEQATRMIAKALLDIEELPSLTELLDRVVAAAQTHGGSELKKYAVTEHALSMLHSGNLLKRKVGDDTALGKIHRWKKGSVS
jgi:hypothetical protein